MLMLWVPIAVTMVCVFLLAAGIRGLKTKSHGAGAIADFMGGFFFLVISILLIPFVFWAWWNCLPLLTSGG